MTSEPTSDMTSAIDETIDRYYEAWTTHDHTLYRTIWTSDATFADPPADDEPPPRGMDEIVAGMDQVWERANSISYDRQGIWRCGSAVAVHVKVTMATPDSTLAIPLIHVFRFRSALIARLEAFLDLDLAEVVSGTRPGWLPAAKCS